MYDIRYLCTVSKILSGCDIISSCGTLPYGYKKIGVTIPIGIIPKENVQVSGKRAILLPLMRK